MTFPPRSCLSISSAMRSSLSAMPRSSFDCSRSFFTRSSLLGRETPRIGSPLFLERGTLINFPDSFCSPFTSFPCFLHILIAFLLFPGATSRGELGRRGDDISRFPLFFLNDRSLRGIHLTQPNPTGSVLRPWKIILAHLPSSSDGSRRMRIAEPTSLGYAGPAV